MGRILLIDPFSGLAGDMFLGALVGLGASVEELRRGLATLPVGGFHLEIEDVQRAGLAAKKARVLLDALGGGEEGRDLEEPPRHAVSRPSSEHGRHPAELLRIIERSELPDPVKAFSSKTFTLLAEAEGRVHGVPPEEVHFHEVGATDALVDICGTALALHLLDIEAVFSRPVHTGMGTVSMAHGVLPVPAPATLALLEGLPVQPTEIRGELVTPTGAALLRAMDPVFRGWPALRVLRTSHGAGTADRAERPNVLRLSLAQRLGGEGAPEGAVDEVIFEVDDMTPEDLALFRARLPREVCLDLSVTPCQMKKGRLGARVRLIVPEAALPLVEESIFRHTSTFGFRVSRQERRVLEREIARLDTPHGPCSVKLGRLHGRLLRVQPEADDLDALARASGLDAQRLRAEITAAAWRVFG